MKSYCTLLDLFRVNFFYYTFLVRDFVLPFLVIRFLSGEPEQDLFLLVNTSLLVRAAGATWTQGRQEKNCLKPLLNLKFQKKTNILNKKFRFILFWVRDIWIIEQECNERWVNSIFSEVLFLKDLRLLSTFT